MARRKKAPVKPWVHLEGSMPFDQTNGVVAYDDGAERAAEEDRDERDARLGLFEKGAASNIINSGGFGGGF